VIEVTSRIRFNNFCLGHRQHAKITRMLSDPNGNVMFLPKWWEHLMVYAARVLNRHQELVDKIDWDPVIDGRPRKYRRYYKPEVFQLHEAYYPGDVIGVNAVLPDGLSIVAFQQLLDIAGRYRGISPYKPGRKYGTFEVLSVQRRKRPRPTEVETNQLSKQDA
jgi:hypothetical protein